MRSDAPTAATEAQVAVRATGLRKQYRLGRLSSLGGTLSKLTGRAAPAAESSFEALAGIDFEVYRGETVGVVGTNGSGKSTLLQILAGTTLPTDGSLMVRGSVLPLLAVGLAFHPDLTGRENVTLFGASAGIPLKTIRERLDDVIEFSGVGKHIDTPVKRFSSGMMSRLSVAIAVQFPADIYIFDEVLAVVDREFQERCLAVIKAKHTMGCTVFFVSHTRSQVEALCSRVLWLDGGRVRAFGPASEVLDAYGEHHASA